MADQQDKYDNERFRDPEAMSSILDGDWREEWQYVDEVMSAIVTRDDLKIVDLGAGTGYFTKRLAKALPRGRVHAIDPEEAMVDWIKEKIIPEENLTNVTAGVVPFEDPLLKEVPFEMDILLIGYTYHHLGLRDVRVAYMRDKVRPSLPRDALVVFVDFESFPPNMPEHLAKKVGHDHHGDDHHGSHDHGSHDHGHHHHGSHDHPEFVTPEELKKEMDSAGFTFVTDYGFDHKPNYIAAYKLKA